MNLIEGDFLDGDVSTEGDIVEFRERVWRFATSGGRRDFAWRRTTDPYEILVSEIMLQQTQTGRVEGYFERFIDSFPSFGALAAASRTDLLTHWQGLGYNRRAIFLQHCCTEILEKHGGELPADEKILRSLPGIGPYTAAALRAFVFNLPAVVIETNIRAVFIEEFFRNATRVSDSELHPLVAKACDNRAPREWYYALMDLGASLKRSNPRLTGKSRAYVRQSRFEGSVRQVRGAIVREMVRGEGGPRTIDRLFYAAGKDIGELERVQFERALMSLVKDEFVFVAGGEVILCDDR